MKGPCSIVFLLSLVLIGSIIHIFAHMPKSNPIPFLAATVLSAFFALWFWTVGIVLNKKVDRRIRMKRAFFKFAGTFPYVCGFAYSVILVVPEKALLRGQFPTS